MDQNKIFFLQSLFYAAKYSCDSKKDRTKSDFVLDVALKSFFNESVQGRNLKNYLVPSSVSHVSTTQLINESN